MDELPLYYNYTVLFNAVTDAIDLIVNEKAKDALSVLVAAQQSAEELNITEEE